MKAHIIIAHNPFALSRDRDHFAVCRPQSVGDWLTAQGREDFERPTICLYNGQPLLRAEWPTTQIADGDHITFVALPQGGGGGGGGGSDPVRTVLTVAVLVAASWAGPVAAGALGFTGAAAGAVATGVIAASGSLLLNALLPPPGPNAPSIARHNATRAASPTYSLQAQGNAARLLNPIPVLYGRHLIYPDFATRPWGEYKNNEQYLNQLHVIGQGEYDLGSLRIQDTPISSFDEITWEKINPGGRPTLFDSNIVVAPEVAGQEITASNDRKTGDDGILGPFVANPAETQTDQLAVDFVFPRGLYYANNGRGLSKLAASWRIEARKIDDDGAATGRWKRLATGRHEASTNTPIRLTYKYTVAAGRYQVRIIRTDKKNLSARAGHDLRWEGLRARVLTQPDFSGLTLLAVRMRATDNLSARSSKLLNVVAQRKLPVWEPKKGWSKTPVATRSIAWAFADICRASYGGKMADARIDLAALHDLDKVWAKRGDHFDAVFDTATTVWDALGSVARCGRAFRFAQGGGSCAFCAMRPRVSPWLFMGRAILSKTPSMLNF